MDLDTAMKIIREDEVEIENLLSRVGFLAQEAQKLRYIIDDLQTRVAVLEQEVQNWKETAERRRQEIIENERDIAGLGATIRDLEEQLNELDPN